MVGFMTALSPNQSAPLRPSTDGSQVYRVHVTHCRPNIPNDRSHERIIRSQG
ncbi:hypothetical protein WN55_02882 [Dufourea novaeangliae]|uniref:Uncharacterized protein n=1 Tax=Dufourea novaeangliae TaxID=178035 RepID=A0A154PK52_DUFNO|nr:hypothetical protein WN55_02882 [Dufourea novaeangliae]